MPFSDNVQLLRTLLCCLVVAISVQCTNSGFACLSNPCIHGVCLDDLNTTYSCYCIDGYTGVQCQTNWDECWSSPCQNGGVCIDGIASFNCSCPMGYVGDLCEENFNECESNPCLNNGTCTDNLNSYTCTCSPGYSGTHCEIDVAVCNTSNETRCSNGGVCVEGPGATFTCRCQPGWEGFLCEHEIDECRSAPCQNGAVCIDMHADYACACLFGYTGKNCDEVVLVCENNPCRNSALCLTEDNRSTCYCVPDYHGDLCQFQYDECQLGPRCMNGGTCIDGIDNFTCSCPPNLTGVLCECLIIGENKHDCTYVSPTVVVTDATTMNQSVSKTYTTKESALETTYSTQVPNLYSNSTIVSEFSTFFTSPSTEYGTGFSKISTQLTTTPETSTISTITPESSTISDKTDEIIDVSSTSIKQEQSTTSSFSEEINTTDFMVIKTTSSELAVVTTIPDSSTELFLTTSASVDTTIVSFSTDSTMYTFPFTPSSLETEPTSLYISSTPQTSFITDYKEGKESNIPEVTSATSLLSTFLTTLPEMSTEFTVSQTTRREEESTTETSIEHPDCTILDSYCQNGGTCVYTSDGYKCICPFDTEGVSCEVRLGIVKAAFAGDSYLSHRILNYSKIAVDLRAKTLSPSGLIFYSNIDSIYMTLYLQHGYLQFRFSCGFQTMLLSELNVPINNGYEMKISAILEFDKDFKHCDASINVNSSLMMTGDQIAIVNKLIEPTAWLHLGAIPPEFIKENLPQVGFVGCMMDLKIQGKKTSIFKDAESGFEVSECSSLACLSNPCGNGATCASKGEDWLCHCKNGYVGRMCESSVCDNNPCLFGGTCVSFTGSGYVCLCPFGKHGHFCENDLQITEPNFSSAVHGLSSYAAYPIPGGISKNMELKFRFTPTTMDQISILMFIGQKGFHDSYSDHMAVSFVKGYIMLTWNLGSGPRRIFTTNPISNNHSSHLVRVGYFGRRAWLFVENLGNITGRSPGSLLQLDVYPLLYLGGHDSKNFSTLPHDLPLHTGFSGCIYDVELKSGSIVMPLQPSRQAVGRALGQCGTTECYERVCQNGGACLHHGSTFMCLCQDGWFGPLCSTKYNPCDSTRHNCSSGSTCVPVISGYECDCPIGRTGKYCEVEEILTDVKFSGKRSFLALELLNFDNRKFTIDLQLRILSDRGLILYTGKESSFLSLSLQSSLLEVKILLGKQRISFDEIITIRSNKLLAMGIWYNVQVGVYGRKVYLVVDNVINTGILNASEILSIAGETIFIGGSPDLSKLPSNALSSLPVSFTGCVRHLSLNSLHIPLNNNTIKIARNIADCDGTPCGGDACENGGSCWIDPNLTPHCNCPEPYYGARCENTPPCSKKLCQNSGRCLNSKCICSVGWSGAFCETAINVKTPKFDGKSYLIIKKVIDKKRHLDDLHLRNIFLNFTTAKPNGLLLWSGKGKNFIGVGIENGHLKVIYAHGIANRKVVEMPNFGRISDGLWHTLEISFLPLDLRFDNKTVLFAVEDKKDVNSLINTDGTFYLGGVSANRSVVTETHGIFSNYFDGCVEAFRVNDKLITDFAKYEGENIDVCNLV